MNKNKSDRTGLEVAVIGMAGRFPEARDIHRFWDNLKNGVESISFFSDEVLEKEGVQPEMLQNPNYVKAKGILEDIEDFDARFFDYTPLEAEIMSPQLRILLECSWEALEDAGYDPESYLGLIGLYAGASSTFHWEGLALLSGKSAALGGLAAITLTNKDFLTTTISYKLNLKGPSSIVQTACSTSLVAIHWAGRAVLSGECHIALAGGIGVDLPQKSGYLYQEGMIPSPDGSCRAFDAKAKGTITGNGAGMVVLKRLKNALADRDNIYAVIKGSAINNDGKRKVGYTAPSVKGQVEVIRTALAVARVEPESINYIETHGTGTPLGDPVEIEALTMVFNTHSKRSCPIGSVKTNIGHLDAAAGAAGFIKTVLALKHRLIPPSLHFETPNPEIDFENSPFYVNTQLSEWKNVHFPLRAGVSSFGIGGTNAHVILEEAPEGTRGLAPLPGEETPSLGKRGRVPPYQSRQYQLILLSAKTETALEKAAENLVEYFKNHPEVNLADAAYTLQLGRKRFKYRRMLVCSTVNEAVDVLSSGDSRKVYSALSKHDRSPVIFMFSGLGSQYVNMGSDLYKTEPIFREEMDRCFEILKPITDYDIKEILYPHSDCKGGSPCPPKDCVGSQSQGDSAQLPGTADSPLERGTPDSRKGGGVSNQIEIAQIVIFIFAYALAKLLMSWGIKPKAMIGYSFGEYAAACLSGVFSLEDALKLVVLRGKLIKKIPTGAMLSVPLTREQLEPLLNQHLSIAIDNGFSCIVAGSHDKIDAFQNQIKEKRILGIPVPASHAIHSKMMEPFRKEFEEKLRSFQCKEPQIPYISNVTGNWLTTKQALDPTYWSNHLRETVQFAAGMKELLKEENALLIEIGPGQDLKAMAVRYLDSHSHHSVINLVKHPQRNISDLSFLLNKIGKMWLYGVKVDWSGFYSAERRCRIPLPTYPFERQPYWIDLNNNCSEPIIKKQTVSTPDIADWSYLPTWKRSIRKRRKNKNSSIKQCWLLFINELNLGALLLKKVKQNNQDVIIVEMAHEFSQPGDDRYGVNPQKRDHYDSLFKELQTKNHIPDKIIHLWGVTGENEHAPPKETFDQAQYLGFYSLLYMVKALEKQHFSKDITITVLTNHVQEVIGGEALRPEKSTVLGLMKSIPQEYPGLRCSAIDICLPEPDSPKETGLIHALLDEINADSPEPVVAYRNNQRWLQIFEPLTLEEVEPGDLGLRQQGVYLVTGGLGEIGLMFSQLLAQHGGAGTRLILTGRSSFLASHEWNHWLDTHDASHTVSVKIKQLQKLEEIGARVLILQADVADFHQMRRAIDQAEATFGTINGVIHAAGLFERDSMRTLQELSDNDCQKQFQAKVYGTLILEELLKEKEPDFCWMLSSISCVLGGLGFGAYASANLFMDVLVKRHNQLNPSSPPWFSLNWDGMEPEKSIAIFERIFSLEKVDQLVVSNGGNLHERIDKWIKLESLRQEADSKDAFSARFHPRPDLSGAYVAPRNPCEKAIVQLWQNLLGYDEIGVQDDFLELGGDSLKSITMISRIHREWDVNVPISTFLINPTIEALAAYISSITETSHYIPVELAEEKEIYPLSAAQEGLYLLQYMKKDTISYNMTYIMVVKHEIDKNRLEHAVRKLVKRHESLRTSFEKINEKPVQRIHKDIDFSFEYFNLEPVGEVFPDQEVEQIIQRFVRPFDLAKAPLLRMGMIEIPPENSIWMVDMHHIISDGISLQITIEDFMQLYEGKDLPPLTLQYKDYTEWQQGASTRTALEQQEHFWLTEFAGDIPQLNLPYDYARPVPRSFQGDMIDFEIYEQETAALKQLALKEDVTMFVLLLAIYNVLLFKLSSQEDIIVGTGMAGRSSEELYRIIGLFINTLPLRNYPARTKPFNVFLNEVKEKTLLAYENQDYHYNDLVKKLVPNRISHRNPLYDAVIVLQNVDTAAAGKPGFKPGTPASGMELYNHTNKISKYDISLICTQAGNRINFMMEYCTKLFKKETVERFVDYFMEIISQVLADDKIKLEDIAITHQLLSAKAEEYEDQMVVDL